MSTRSESMETEMLDLIKDYVFYAGLLAVALLIILRLLGVGHD